MFSALEETSFRQHYTYTYQTYTYDFIIIYIFFFFTNIKYCCISFLFLFFKEISFGFMSLKLS